MTATKTWKKLHGQTGIMVQCLVLLAAFLSTTSLSQAATIYADGDAINLVSGRSNMFTSSGAAAGIITGPVRPVYLDTRFDAANSVDGAYWQVNFPTGYDVSSVFVETHPVGARMTSMSVQTTTDGVTWIPQSSASVVGSSTILSTNFTPVSGVVGVRLLSTGSENSSYPAIFRYIRVTGPNDSLPLYLNGQSEFSVTSALWSGASVQSASGWGPYSGGSSLIGPIDDATMENFDSPLAFNKTIYSSSVTNPSPIDILLNDNYFIDTVAISTANDARAATHVDISYSSDITGGFTSILQDVELLGSPDSHYVIDLGGLFDARRIRYEFSRAGSGDTFISDLYAFATEVNLPSPAPEPSSMTIFALGLGLLATKRRCRV